jgi:hypothetical protein
LQIGTSYLLNCKATPVDEMTSAILDEQWSDKTIDQCEWDNIECTEKVKLKKA